MAFQREESRVDVELVRDFSQVWRSGQHPPALKISKGREWGWGGAEGSVEEGGYSGYCSYNRSHTFTPRAERALESL